MKLLTRDEFREGVFERDKNKCVICSSEGQDAHHIVERRLWHDGGYYIENGATLCGTCHIQAEETTIDCNTIREKANITRIVLPDHFYGDLEYDKWGNVILPSGRRLKGELFFDESVQKILKQGNVLNLFDDYVKYPRTHHFPWSFPSKDDRIIKTLSSFEGKEIVVTLKMDGENFSGYKNYCHARSLEPLSGEDRGQAKAIWASMAHDIPDGWRFCAENLYAQHSIAYNDLDSFLQVFSVWNEKNECLSWDETQEWCELWGLTTVPVLYRGVFDEKILKQLSHDCVENGHEGYVCRVTQSFSYFDFKKYVAKMVRKNHVTTDSHWRFKKIIPNRLKSLV